MLQSAIVAAMILGVLLSIAAFNRKSREFTRVAIAGLILLGLGVLSMIFLTLVVTSDLD